MRQRTGEDFFKVAQIINMNLITFTAILLPEADIQLVRAGAALVANWKPLLDYLDHLLFLIIISSLESRIVLDTLRNSFSPSLFCVCEEVCCKLDRNSHHFD